MALETRAAAGRFGWFGAWRRYDPLYGAWKLLTNVRFAIFIILVAVVITILGVVMPQVPGQIRGIRPAELEWLDGQADTFGVFTDWLWRLGLFNVYHQWWFAALWLLIVVSVCVCTISRFPPIWRAVTRPPKRVNDAYFESARQRLEFSHPGGAGAVAEALRRHRYTVQEVSPPNRQEGASYLFADRYPWAQLFTFVSHLSLIMLLAGGLLTRFAGFEAGFSVPEGSTMPVFDLGHERQILVQVDDAIRKTNEEGLITDFRALITLFEHGEEVAAGGITVNSPLKYGGHTFYLATFSDNHVEFRVREQSSGRVVFSRPLTLSAGLAAPWLRVSAPDGSLLMNEAVPPTRYERIADPSKPDEELTNQDFFGYSTIAVPGSPLVLTAGVRQVDGEWATVLTGTGLQAPLVLSEGETVTIDGYQLTASNAVLPHADIRDLPGAEGENVRLVMARTTQDEPYLLVIDLNARQAFLAEGAGFDAGNGYEYTFVRQIDAAGLTVRRDPGDTFVWVGVAMLMVGLAATFYLPRGRMWVKVTPERTYLAGIAERTTRLTREMRKISASLEGRDLSGATTEREDDDRE